MSEDTYGLHADANNPSRNWARLAFSVAKITSVQYEEMKCSLKVLTGEQDIYEYSGVDLPGGGRRFFFGAVPEVGDFCYVGWKAQESSGVASGKAPVIVGMMTPAPWMGHEWLPFSSLDPTEGLGTPRDRAVAQGAALRVRHKMRHVGPGDVLASSSRGSDLSLGATALLTNRRGSELVLRDEDSTALIRSVRGVGTYAGVRTYAGPVQRDARALRSRAYSDGIYWEAPRQINASEEPLAPAALGAHPMYPRRYLTPGEIFIRVPGTTLSEFASSNNWTFPARLDPYGFLRWSGLLDAEGSLTSTLTPATAVVGGTPIYRVGVTEDGRSTRNGLLGGATLSEWRVEVADASDNSLPVSSDTDGFEADRYPVGDLSNPLNASPRLPTVEFALGNVVGNDAFSLAGRGLYGVPLRPVVGTDGGPRLASALGAPSAAWAATLLKVRVPAGPQRPEYESWSSFTKEGGFKAYLGAGPLSAEVATFGDLNLTVGGRLVLNLAGGISFAGGATTGGVGLNLGSPNGAVVISGGGQMTAASGARAATEPGPSVMVEGATGVTMRGGTSVDISSPAVSIRNSASVTFQAQSDLTLSSGRRLSIAAATLDKVVYGSERVQYSGPADGLPVNGATRVVTFSSTPATGHISGTVDHYKMVYGDRLEEFTNGDTATRMTSGSITHETTNGQVTARAGGNTYDLDSTGGRTETIGTGDATATVAGGSYSVSASGDVTLETSAGVATVKATGTVKLVSTSSPANGGILCGSDLDPFTGLPFSTFIVPRGQRLSSS